MTHKAMKAGTTQLCSREIADLVAGNIVRKYDVNDKMSFGLLEFQDGNRL